MTKIMSMSAGALVVVVAAGCAPASTPQATTADERLAAEYRAECEKTWNDSGKNGPLAYQGHDTYVRTCAEGRNPYTSTTRSAAAASTTTTRPVTTTSTVPCPPGTVTTHITGFDTSGQFGFGTVTGMVTNTFPDPVTVRAHADLAMTGWSSNTAPVNTDPDEAITLQPGESAPFEIHTGSFGEGARITAVTGSAAVLAWPTPHPGCPMIIPGDAG